MLAKLNVRQKLTLLLMLPFFAVFLTSVPFAIGQVNTAVAAGATVDVAERARLVGVLVQDLQEERLLALAFLATRDTDQSAFVSRTAASIDSAHNVEEVLVLPRDVKLKTALGGLRALDTMRRSVLGRSTEAKSVFDSYHRTISNLIDALGLTQQEKADATGVRQMNTLDALLRTNEEIGRIGGALVLASTDVSGAATLIEEAQLLRKADASRFRQQADSEENTLLNLIEQGPTGRRNDALAKQVTDDHKKLAVTEALAAAHTMVALTRVQQERIARDIAVRAQDRASNARLFAGMIIGGAALLVGIVILLSVAVSQSVAGPLRKLTEAAGYVADIATAELTRVADSEIENAQAPQLRAVEIQTQDEIGEMAAAFNRVQMTAAKLMEQQIATRRNTAVMFANIARRTRSMVARQLTFIDDLERNEQNERLLAKLYRLDHLTTRLHRSADSLLVVSGAREDERIVSPAPLPEVVRSAVAEIEGYQNVQAGPLAAVIVAPQLVPDLRLVLAELLENATAFSPPGSPVNISATVDGPCKIVIVDHGIGMSDERLADENRRLVERERLDIVPTSVLGLFVVGRLARRHGLNVELVKTGELGITATVTVPVGLFNDGSRQAGMQPAQAAAPAGATIPSAATLEALASAQALATPPKTEPVQPPATSETERQPSLRKGAEGREGRRDQSSTDQAAPTIQRRTPQGPREKVAPQPPREPVIEPVREPQREALADWANPPEPGDQVQQGPTEAPQQQVQEVPAQAAEARATAAPPVAEPVRQEPVQQQEPVREEPVQQQPVQQQEPVRQEPVQQQEPVREEPVRQEPARPEPVVAQEPTSPPVAPDAQDAADDSFGWFVPPPDLPEAPPVPGSVPPDSTAEQAGHQRHTSPRHAGREEGPPSGSPNGLPANSPSHRGLTRRQPGGHLPSFGIGQDDPKASPVTRDAVAERAELEAFAMGTAQAAAARLKRAGLELPEPPFQPPERPSAPREDSAARRGGGGQEPSLVGARSGPGDSEGTTSTHGGLTRRMPGTHLSEYLRATGPRTATPTRTTSRDADAERAALDSFIDGLARAEVIPDQANHS